MAYPVDPVPFPCGPGQPAGVIEVVLTFFRQEDLLGGLIDLGERGCRRGESPAIPRRCSVDRDVVARAGAEGLLVRHGGADEDAASDRREGDSRGAIGVAVLEVMHTHGRPDVLDYRPL